MSKWRVIHGDCREVVPTIPFQFDFVFADPPFNIGHGYTGFNDRIEPGAYAVFTLQWVLACWEKCDGVMALHGPDALVEQYLKVAEAGGFAEDRIAWVNWHYRFGQCNRSNWIDARCHCLIYSKAATYTWNPDAVMVPSDRAAVYGDKRTQATTTPGLRLPGTIWGVPSDGPYWGRVSGNNTERRHGHPNQLPEAYLGRLIRAYTNPGDKILDPFCGSGTTAAVAVALGRSCVTIDISEENCESAMDRIRNQPVRVM
jgi:DNA modification methylase